MHYLELALASPVVTTRPEILNLFDRSEKNSQWLSTKNIWHTNCPDENDLRTVIDSGHRWDLVIATTEMQRVYATTSEPHLHEFIDWLKTYSKLCLVVPQQENNDPVNRKIGPFQLNPLFTTFKYFSEMPNDPTSPDETPVVALSDNVLFDGLDWHENRKLTSLTAWAEALTGVAETFRRPRTFMHDEGFVIKSQLGCPDYFDSLEILREAEVLENLPSSVVSTLHLPRLMSLNRGRAVSTMVREGIPGRRASEISGIDAKDARRETMKQVLDLAKSYADLNLFHNDFRPWNILSTPDGLRMIDYADISTADQDARDLPQIIALIGTLTIIGNLGTDGFPLREGEWFDIDLLEIMKKYVADHEIKFGSLYGQPWLRLSELSQSIDFSAVETSFDLCNQLIAPIKEWIGP